MKRMLLIDQHKEPLGAILWMSPDQMEVQIENPAFANAINALLDQTQETGLPWQWGERIERDGKTLLVDKVEIIKQDHELFLNALANYISQVRFSGQRIFGFLQEEHHVES